MTEKSRFSVPAIGGSALITMFAVLCLTIFALLGLGTALSGQRLSEKNAENTLHYYAASLEAEEIFARLRAGEMPEGVGERDGRFVYSCAAGETAVLEVELLCSEGEWSVLRWQSLPAEDWESDGTLPVWKGGNK